MKDYINIGPDVLYLNFRVAKTEGVYLVLQRRGGGSSVRVEPFEINGDKARFIADDPGFGLPCGWYEATIYEGCCPCKTYIAKVAEDCLGEFTGKEEIVFDKDTM